MRGWKHCSRCGRWRPITDFSPRAWTTDEAVKYLSSECGACRRQLQRQRYQKHPRTERMKRRQRLYARAYKRRLGVKTIKGPRNPERSRPGSVPSAPFVAWASARMQIYGSINNLALACEVSPRWLLAVLRGYTYKGKLRPIDGIDLGTVDRILLAEGSTRLDELYPLKAEADDPA